MHDKLLNTILIMSSIVGSVAYCFTTFATIDYVDKKHQQVISEVIEVKDVVKDTQKLMIDLIKESKNNK